MDHSIQSIKSFELKVSKLEEFNQELQEQLIQSRKSLNEEKNLTKKLQSEMSRLFLAQVKA